MYAIIPVSLFERLLYLDQQLAIEFILIYDRELRSCIDNGKEGWGRRMSSFVTRLKHLCIPLAIPVSLIMGIS
jgi:hypothetical protein